MRNKWSILIIILLVVYLMMSIALPFLAKKEISQGFRDNFEKTGNLDIAVRSFPVWEIISGRMDGLEITGKDLYYSGLKIDELHLEYENVSWQDDEIYGDNKDLKLMVTEESMNQYITSNYPEYENFRIDLKPELVLLNGNIIVFDSEIEVKIEGELVLEDDNLLVYVPQNMELARISLPASLIESIISKLEFSLDFNQFDFPVQIEAVKVEEGQCQLLGGLSARKAGF